MWTYGGQMPLIIPVILALFFGLIIAFYDSTHPDEEDYWSPRRIREREELKAKQEAEKKQSAEHTVKPSDNENND